ncbi:MAG: class I SAM-dependent methyltransferase [Dehalococcoidia bacterium]
MYKGDPTRWTDLWDLQMQQSHRKEDGGEFVERSRLFATGNKHSNYSDELLSRINTSDRPSVLDIGCGDGAIAVRLARTASQVTALDSDPGLLIPLTQRVMAEGLTNVVFTHADWFDAEIGTTIDRHDIVLASRFRWMTPLETFIRKMDAAARERCYLTWIVERHDVDSLIAELLGEESNPLPRHSILCNAIESIGISAATEIFESIERNRFESEEDALRDALRGHQIPDETLRKTIIDLVSSRLIYKDGYWYLNENTKWALIWWVK